MNTDTAVQWDVFGVLFMDHALPKLIYDRASMRILEVNHAAVRNYGYDRAYFRNMTILDLHIPEHVEDIARLVREGGSAERRHTSLHVTSAGELLDVDIYSQPIDYDGVPARLATVIDTTVRERAQHALADSELLLQAIIDNVAEPVFIKDLHGRYLFINKAGAASFGLYADQVIGKTEEQLRGAEAAPFCAHDDEVLRKGQPSARMIDTVVFGSRRTLHVSKAPWTDADGNVRGVIGSMRDLTEQSAADERFRALVANSAEISLIVDENLRPSFASDATRVLGFTGRELYELDSIMELVHPDDMHIAQSVYQRFLAHPDTPIEYTLRIRHADGSWRYAECVARNLFDHPVIRGGVLNIRDVTDRRATEARLHESEEQLRQAQKMEAVGRLAGGIAHDFNNVLTAIGGHAELLSEMFSPHDPRAIDVAEIKRAAERATQLTRQLLAFSRRQVLQPTVLDLRSVVTNLEKMLQRLLGEDVQLITDIQKVGRVPAVNADCTQLEQVIMNLAVNARDAMPQGGTLTIGVDVLHAREGRGAIGGAIPPGCYVKLSVADTGHGISPELLTNIFEPFYTTKEQGRGTGLGLSTVYGIVQQSGGYICVSSEPGHGSTFEVLLPCVQASEAVAPEIAEVPDTKTLDGSGTVLLVEDDASVRSMAERVLRRHGYDVLSAHNGLAALDVARAARSIDLILTDLVMPQMSGREFAARVGSVHQGARVLFMSGYTFEEAALDGGPRSEEEFLSKPFTPDGLARKVRALLERDR